VYPGSPGGWRIATLVATVVFTSTTIATRAIAQTTAAVETSAATKIARWFELQNTTLNLRYRFIDTSTDRVTTNQIQNRQTIRGRLKFDKSAKYGWNFGVFTGARFTSGWDNTGWGMGGAQRNFALRASYLSAAPVTGVEAQYGGLYILRGESTEVTTYDEDGYVVGQRVTIKRPKQFLLDEISVTVGYLTADPDEVPVGRRVKYLDDAPNYRHILVGKKFGKRVGLSADFTHAGGANTWRQGLNVKTPGLRVVDIMILELYRRVNRSAGRGFALTLDKALHRRFRLSWGYASIDPAYGILNADRFQIGNRLFTSLACNITPKILASAFITRAVGNEISPPQRTLSNIVFTYDLLHDLKKTGLF
jgi:hypothetical protein